MWLFKPSKWHFAKLHEKFQSINPPQETKLLAVYLSALCMCAVIRSAQQLHIILESESAEWDSRFKLIDRCCCKPETQNEVARQSQQKMCLKHVPRVIEAYTYFLVGV